jgi:hypothetical protein
MGNNIGTMENGRLRKILFTNQSLKKILHFAPRLKMPNWYLASGCVAQTVWNTLHGFNPDYGIKDYDLVYYDTSNLSLEREDVYINKLKDLLGDARILLDVKNQARVHLWFEGHFGFKIKPYESVEQAISSWSTTATCIGVRSEGDTLRVFAPYGLDDLFSLIIRPSKVLFTEEMYQDKVSRWRKIWPKLSVIPWGG